ncbi:GNAT family N-acetyltransferase [Gottfriedia acidiceleris]|uniref:GNAT family N-acetyltransferase n=1 Tax=Gottfriedia acidiceleris TaxID=371036 RepID=A0ABY4JJ32_9BACI|nr:GNAT family N-acetyltransferase [Gottfriedia acidiceleris]UPM53850.1 GNAT family N-acetyltransferase [Gottfriedia acidiceleris]
MFNFIKFDNLTDGEIQLLPLEYLQADVKKGFVPAYMFGIVSVTNKEKILGEIVLRVGDNEKTFYGGQIGYKVEEESRGRNYASKACLLVREVAVSHDMKKLIISCNPNNIPSRRTCEKVGASLKDIIDLPTTIYIKEAKDKQVFMDGRLGCFKFI